MVCPKCSSDCIDGAKICLACHVLLDHDSHRVPANGNGRLVHFITYFSKREAETGKKLLEWFDVDALVSIDEIRGIRLWIYKEDVHKAIKLFEANTLAEKKLEKPH
ncbi:MAG: hypothetical protein MUP98_19875 [Candidatus Aminicenantes bacterium]|nr:hypothetical protein [Candidatus Aminicenantes bacterium]